MHVTPQAGGDDVRAAVAPGGSGAVAVTIETDHAAGTYWYHAHHHGSSALQIEGGLGGPLIVIDDATLDARLRAARDIVLVFQHFNLANGAEEDGNIVALGAASKDSFAYNAVDKLGNGAYVLVNGQYRPHLSIMRREPVSAHHSLVHIHMTCVVLFFVFVFFFFFFCSVRCACVW
jgi:FtsP/CotA-like multicopper oxidase with cupredoxin domain